MPLETATYITDLNPANPAHSDGLNNDDAHARMIKGTLKATFPNFTSAPLNSTQAQLDAAATAVNTNGVAILADAGAFFKTNTTDGLQNPAAGQINLKLAGQLAASFTYATSINTLHWFGPATFDGAVSVTGAISGPGIVPIGGMIMWLTDTLPTDGVWCWANGGTLSRTGNGAALYAKWGTTYGAGDGVTTFNVINMQEVVPVGKSTMGGATSPGLLASIASGVKTVLGALFGADTVTLTTANHAPHQHAVFSRDTGHAHTINPGAGGTAGGSNGIENGVFNTINQATSTNPANIIIGSSNGASDNQTALQGSATPFGIAQPSRVVNFIIRIG